MLHKNDVHKQYAQTASTNLVEKSMKSGNNPNNLTNCKARLTCEFAIDIKIDN